MLKAVPEFCFLGDMLSAGDGCELAVVTLSKCGRSKAVVLLWFYVAWFWCLSFGDVSPYVCSYYFSSVLVAEWPPFGKKLLTRLTICCLLYFDYL